VSWLEDIRRQKSAEERKRKNAFDLAVKRVRAKAKTLDPIVQKYLNDFGKTCWGSSLLSDTYAIAAGMRGQNWIWSIEHTWDTAGILNVAALEVHLKIDPTGQDFEFMLIEPEKLTDLGPRYPCTQEGLTTMLREVYERWLVEAHKHHLKQ